MLNTCLLPGPLPFPTILVQIGQNGITFLESLDKEKKLKPADGSEGMRSREGVLHQSVFILLVLMPNPASVPQH